MADTYEKDLGRKSSLTTSDFIRVVGSDNVSYKQPLTAVADTVGTYNTTIQVLTDCNDATNPSKIYYTNANTANRPANISWCFIKCEARSDQMIFQTAMQMNVTGPVVYQRSSTAQGVWGEWQKLPTRAEVDALTNKLTLGTLAQKLVVEANNNQGDSVNFSIYTGTSTRYKINFGRNGSLSLQYYDGSSWSTIWTK